MSYPLAQEELEALLAFSAENTDHETVEEIEGVANRRRFRRFECRLRLDFEGEEISGQGLVKSIGLGGFLLSTASTLTLGEDLRFRLLLDSNDRYMRGSGRIVHVSKAGLGFQFDALTPADVWALMSKFHLV